MYCQHKKSLPHQGLMLILPMYRPHQTSVTQAFTKYATRFRIEKQLLEINMQIKNLKNEKLTEVFPNTCMHTNSQKKPEV